jgi:transcriptional regulator with XRE-family HTH domain
MTAEPDYGAWLRQQREQRRWTRLEMARQIIKAARRHGDATMPSAANLTHNLYRWERGDNGISERYRLYCSEVLDSPPGRLETTTGPAPATGAAPEDKLIVITISLPEAIEAQVKVTKHRVSPPPGPAVPGTAG